MSVSSDHECEQSSSHVLYCAHVQLIDPIVQMHCAHVQLIDAYTAYTSVSLETEYASYNCVIKRQHGKHAVQQAGIHTMGTPAQRMSVADVCAFTSGVSKNTSASAPRWSNVAC